MIFFFAKLTLSKAQPALPLLFLHRSAWLYDRSFPSQKHLLSLQRLEYLLSLYQKDFWWSRFLIGRVGAPLTVVHPSQNPDLRLSRIRLFAKRIVHIIIRIYWHISGVLPVDSCYPAYLEILPSYSFSSGFSGSGSRTGFSWCYIGMPLYFLYCP